MSKGKVLGDAPGAGDCLEVGNRKYRFESGYPGGFPTCKHCAAYAPQDAGYGDLCDQLKDKAGCNGGYWTEVAVKPVGLVGTLNKNRRSYPAGSKIMFDPNQMAVDFNSTPAMDYEKYEELADAAEDLLAAWDRNCDLDEFERFLAALREAAKRKKK